MMIAALPVAGAGETDSGTLPLRPGMEYPQPRQRSLREIAELPVRKEPCPVCRFVVAIPEVDLLMRFSGGAGENARKWRMHAASRDADLCPYPGPGMVAYQADIIVCPACGYAAGAGNFSDPVPEKMMDWVIDVLRPNIRQAERLVIGQHAGELSETRLIEFFNSQKDIPDSVRMEHALLCSQVLPAPLLEQAELAWTAAWALRREIASPPQGTFFRKITAKVIEAMAKRQSDKTGAAGDVEKLNHLLGKNRSGNHRLPQGERFAARLLQTGAKLRLGLHGQADAEFNQLYLEAKDRFLKPEQDPFWPHTGPRGPVSGRIAELDAGRSEIEAELAVRLDLLEREKQLSLQAANLIRDAILAGELDGKRDETLFHAYLVGEFLRRHDKLPLAAEWFKNTLQFLRPDEPLYQAVTNQLAMTREQAGDEVNLLSALGQDGEHFQKLREICGLAPAPVR